MKKFFYPLVNKPYRRKDILAGINALKSGKLTIGKITEKFEQKFKKKLNLNFSLMTNSGSSANLLALQCLINPYRKFRLKKNDEVLVPALCWSTSLWPIIQAGLKPKFIDIDKDTLNIDLNDLKKKISKKTKAILLVHVLGLSTNMKELIKIKKKHNLILIEDTCESLGTKYSNKYLGSYGEFSSFSFHSSHQISSGEGGMICCKNQDDYEIIKSLRSHGWLRGHKNEKKIASDFPNLDKRFIFYNSGFNLRPTEINAAIGYSQFVDMDDFILLRNKNRNSIIRALKRSYKISKKISFLEIDAETKPSWFGLVVFLNKKINKRKFIYKLEKYGVETRPIISGNFLKQPSIKKYQIKDKFKFKNADYADDYGFYMGLPTERIKNSSLKKLVKAFEKSL
tara:strand:+ start:3244 stop:4434 length:1191 start_codon:yes stop_codon:yes gene_type:complete